MKKMNIDLIQRNCKELKDFKIKNYKEYKYVSQQLRI